MARIRKLAVARPACPMRSIVRVDPQKVAVGRELIRHRRRRGAWGR